jgi:Protein of unknown function (DUF1501)
MNLLHENNNMKHHSQIPGLQNSEQDQLSKMTRRHLFKKSGVAVGAMALGSLLERDQQSKAAQSKLAGLPHFPPKAKSIIYLFMAGGPSQLDLLVNKPALKKNHGKLPPKEFLENKRFAFLKGTEKLLGSSLKFKKYGECGQDLSNLLPHHQKIVDDVCWLHGMKTDVFNHGPAKLFANTGSPQPGRPGMGAWVTYGLGSEADNLPGFVVLQSGPRGPRAGSSLWSSGFLPTSLQGVPFRNGPEPILNLNSPSGITRKQERKFVDTVNSLNQNHLDDVGDPEIATRIAAYEMAYQMQASAPELVDLTSEPKHVLDMYGAEPGKNSYANNCLLARRLIEKGTRFVQLYHTNWDHHGGPSENLNKHLPQVSKEIDQASVALILDLKQRGLLDETIVIWGGEFGRTPMGEIRNSLAGRDHHIDAYSMWVAGGGFKPGIIHGKTDELGLSTVENTVHVHDFNATILHQLGIDHKRLTFRFQGRDYRLTDVHGELVKEIIT